MESHLFCVKIIWDFFIERWNLIKPQGAIK